ncbi:MAG: LemA family protein [candidate division KSB1 bacterium]|nr:LemA family protein [candidate division KSB1 bacterium]MDZ7273350.1 LemA family protein [candidate division KSB1 bacterium]MDZ7288012.1 LemA family protein [candidate division KSB1 bacterium]MDZ7300136.1 LemA family protein [candidate division KSB1 bacterium]MDZ7308476.1 LemA family protein [candidate division KSB1 bacterium]
MSKKFLIGVGIIVLLVLFVYSFFSGNYNKLVSLDEGVKQAWAEVQNNYQRRADLIPNLVETVKGAAKFEQETLQKVIEARSNATRPEINAENVLNDPQAFQRFQQAQDNLGAALSRLLVVVERYPELKANQNYLDLQTQLEGTENRLTTARRRFNEAVQTYNSMARTFPVNLIAGMFGFQQRPYFEASAAAQRAPRVDFGGDKN